MRTRTIGRARWASPVVLAVVVLLVGVASPGDARPGTRPTALRAAASGPGIPPVTENGYDSIISFDPVLPSVAKAKVQFTLPKIRLQNTLTTCFVSQGFSYPDPCPVADLSTLPLKQPDDTWAAAVADAWVVTPGPPAGFGRFPDVRVNALAFGSIPVSATVHLTQTVHRNRYDPIRLSLVLFNAFIAPGRVVYPGYGPAPDFAPEQGNFSLPTHLSGTLDVRLSDVTVDQVPVDVGAGCRTARPARLEASVPGGYYPTDNDANKHRDRAGGFLPLLPTNDTGTTPAGWIDGSVDIPAFRGCGSHGEDLDPLLTGLISGPGNPISAYASTTIFDCSFALAHCLPRQAAAQQAARAFARAVGSRSIPRIRQAAGRLAALPASARNQVKAPKAPKAR